MSKEKQIAICHQTITIGDAIGNDIFGMYNLLESIGFEPTILCEYIHNDVKNKKIKTEFDINEINNYGMVIYHHSIYWEKGERILNAYKGKIILRYHSITPPYFFEPYTQKYAKVCADGQKQTKRFVKFKKNHFWLADSHYNRNELLELGERNNLIEVVPPFNNIDDLLTKPNVAQYGSDTPIYLLFIGRLAPNKGHDALLKIVHSYKTKFCQDPILRIVGTWSPEIDLYRAEIEALIDQLGLGNNVELLPYVSQDTLEDFFRTSHLYLCLSKHEGFCVPIIEAQAVGLPIVTSNSTAKKDTAGSRQLKADQPYSELDYFYYARLIREVCNNADLRRTLVHNGYRNIMANFTKEKIENTFLEALLPFIR